MGNFKVTPTTTGMLRFGSSISGDVTGSLPGGTVVEQVNGLPPSWKNAVRAATTVAGTLATSFENGDTIDGEVLVTGDRILIKNQASSDENGVYIVSTTGAPVRAPDMDEADEVLGSVVYVIEGTANAGTIWVNTNTTEPVLETDAITFVAFGSTPAGNFLTIVDGGGGTVQAHGSLGATETIDTANGNYHWGTLNANCTFTFTTTVDTAERWFTLELIEDGTGGWTVTWPGSVVWLGGSTPAHTTTAGTTTIYAFFTRNGGTTWIGGQLGGGGGAPTTVDYLVGTASGSLSAEIVVGTSPGGELGGTWASPTVDTVHSGSAHLTADDISSAGFVGAILISDTPSTPLVFADLIQNEAQNDLVYADV